MHMKRYTMPSFWPLGRKREKFVVTPSPGPHPKGSSIPLRIAIRDVLSLAEDAAEVRKIVKGGSALVDKRRIKDDRYPLGIMDVLEFPAIKKQFRVVAGEKGLELSEIDSKDTSKKLCSIKSKKTVRGGKTQIALHDGRSIVLAKKEAYKPGDSVLIELPAQKILSHFSMKEGVPAVVISGKNSGASGKIKSVFNGKTMKEKGRVVLQTDGGEIETLKEYVLVGEVK